MSYAYYQKLVHFGNKYNSHYDKTAKNCGPLLLQAMLVSTLQTSKKLVFIFEC